MDESLELAIKLELMVEHIKSLGPVRGTEVAKQAMAQIYRNDLFVLARGLLQFEDINWKTHGDIILTLESTSLRKLIVVPRGSLKSTLAAIAYPIWLLIRNPNARILIDSELYTNSKNFVRAIRAILESPRMVSLFGKFKHPTNWNEGEITILQRTKLGLKESSITAGGIGTTKVGQHYDYIIGDDYNSKDNSGTPERRIKVIEHYKYNISILEKPNGVYAITATRYAEDDIPGHVLLNYVGIDKPIYGRILSLRTQRHLAGVR